MHGGPVPVMVTTSSAATGNPVSSRTIDHSKHTDRDWLGKHCFWALRNGLSVTTAPIKAPKSEAA